MLLSIGLNAKTATKRTIFLVSVAAGLTPNDTYLNPMILKLIGLIDFARLIFSNQKEFYRVVGFTDCESIRISILSVYKVLNYSNPLSFALLF